jgi:hypothetical protein
VPVYPITCETAELVGKINAEALRPGITIPFDDLLIGACTLELGYAVATRNRRHFEKFPGLKLVSIQGRHSRPRNDALKVAVETHVVEPSGTLLFVKQEAGEGVMVATR